MVNDQPAIRLKNALANSPSPYVSRVSLHTMDTANSAKLRAHKNNPVAWQDWSEDTIALSRQHQRLIFLSIGYTACHCTSLISTSISQELTNQRVPCYGKGVVLVS